MTETTPINPIEDRRSQVTQMATDVLNAGDAIIQERNLSQDPKPGTLAWVLRGRYTDLVKEPVSFTANALERARSLGQLENRWLYLGLENFQGPVEEGLAVFAGQGPDGARDISHSVSKAFLEKLGFTVPQTPEDWQTKYDTREGVIRLDNPSKPYSAEGVVRGTTNNGEPRLVGIGLVPKTSPRAVAPAA